MRPAVLHPLIGPAVLVALTAHATPAIEQDGPSFDCARAETAATQAVCADPALAALDRELNRLYGLAAGDPTAGSEALATLRAMQRGWIKGRDECWKADDLRPCIRDAYAIRIAELRSLPTLDPKTEGASRGPVRFVCDDLDDTISATFIVTAEPLAILEWREQTLVLPAAPAASGARYEGPDNAGGIVMFWTQGDTALVTPPDGIDRTCHRQEAR